jgi:uncharacterized protein (TIGR02594 family)
VTIKLPKAYEWLNREPGPRILLQGIKTYGVAETPGPGNTPTIMAWAKRTVLDRIYKADATAWCGLWMAYTALEAGWDVNIANPLGARQWLGWGRPNAVPELGNVLVFWRVSPKGWQGHVGMYVAEDRDAFHVLGGNQSDKVSIARIAKARLLGARECPWRVAKPANVRRVLVAASGALSVNEA